MTIKELVEKRLLKKVDVRKPPDNVMDAGNKRFVAVFNIPKSGGGPQRMRCGKCQSNSICVVAAMRNKGEKGWEIVTGFAFNNEEEGPISHVWVNKRSQHYDPTWSLDLCNYNPEDCKYYQVAEPLKNRPWETETVTKKKIGTWGENILAEMENLASKWGLKLAADS